MEINIFTNLIPHWN